VKIRLVFGLICVVSAFALVFFGLVGISAATQPGYEFSGFMTDYVRTQLIAFAADSWWVLLFCMWGLLMW